MYTHRLGYLCSYVIDMYFPCEISVNRDDQELCVHIKMDYVTISICNIVMKHNDSLKGMMKYGNFFCVHMWLTEMNTLFYSKYFCIASFMTFI